MLKTDFPILQEKVYGKPLVYLDNAATTQKPQCVIDAIGYAYTHFNSNIHRGVHYLSRVATANHEEARKKIAGFIGASSEKEIIFTKGTTDSVNMLAWSLGEWKENGHYWLQPGDEIIISALEHHSNIVPWQMLCERRGLRLRVIPLNADLTLDIEAYKSLLSSRTRIVSVAHVSNVLGIINDVRLITGLAHKAGALMCIDAAQSVPHMHVDVHDIDCDFMFFSAHKMYGPTGIGVLYGREQLLSVLPPAEGGGEMIEHVSFDKTTYNTLPYKFEAGTPDFIGSYAFAIAADYMNNIGIYKLTEHEAALTNKLEEALLNADLSGAAIKIYCERMPKAAVLSFNVFNKQGKLIHPYDVGMLLDRQGIAIRTGHHCAEPLVVHLGVPGTIRVSLALYSDENDIISFTKALEKAVAMLV